MNRTGPAALALALLFLSGCKSPEPSFSDASPMEDGSCSVSFADEVPAEEYYQNELYAHVYALDPWQNAFLSRADGQIFYRHSAPIQTAFYYNHAAFYFLSEDAICRLSLPDAQVQKLLERPGIFTFQPLTGDVLLYQTVTGGESAFFLFDSQTGEETEISPQAYGYDDSLLTSRRFALSPESLYDRENRCLLPDESGAADDLTFDAYFSQERAYEYPGDGRCFLPKTNTFYRMADGVFSPYYQAQHPVDTYHYFGEQLLLFSCDGAVFRVFLPTGEAQQVYESQDPFHRHPYTSQSLILFEGQTAEGPEHIYYYHLVTKEKIPLTKEEYQAKYSLLE